MAAELELLRNQLAEHNVRCSTMESWGPELQGMKLTLAQTLVDATALQTATDNKVTLLQAMCDNQREQTAQTQAELGRLTG